MSARGLTSITVFAAALAGSQGIGAQDPSAGDPDPVALEARVWLDRGVDPVLRRGDRVRVYYRTAQDAFVGIFQIDTNGFVRLLFPRSPADDHYVSGGRDYRLLFPSSPYWRVDENEGKGYLFVVAATTPLDFSAFSYSRYDGGWDLSSVAQNVYSDPYVAMDDFVDTVIPDWEYAGYALDFATYDVDRSHDYPRFLCYDCHGFQPFNSWNPYGYYCTNFRVVVYDDPYFYPSYRYSGTRVVYVRPPAPRQPMFVFKERAPGEPGTPVVQTRPADRPGVRGDPPRRGVGGAGGLSPADGAGAGVGRGTTAVPPRRTPAASVPGRPGQSPDAGASSRTLRPDPTRAPPRRPSEVLPGAPGRNPPVVRRSGGNRPERPPIQSPPPGERDRRPTLERRPDPRSGGVQRSMPDRVRPGAPSARPDRGEGRPTAGGVPSTGSTPRTIRGTPPTRPPPASRPARPPAGSSAATPRTQTRPPRRPPPATSPARPPAGSSAATPRAQTRPPPTPESLTRPRRRPPVVLSPRDRSSATMSARRPSVSGASSRLSQGGAAPSSPAASARNTVTGPRRTVVAPSSAGPTFRPPAGGGAQARPQRGGARSSPEPVVRRPGSGGARVTVPSRGGTPTPRRPARRPPG